MKPGKRATEKRRGARHAWMGIVVLLAMGLPAMAKVDVDFDPNLDFSKFKTFAYIGGVEHLVMMQLNPELINERVRQAVQREMAKRGWRKYRSIRIPTWWCVTGLTAIRN
jgi:hypothetical protein